MKKHVRKIAAAIGLYAMLGGSLWAAQKPAPAAPEQASEPASKPASAASPTAPDHAKSYYHFMLARRYKELAGVYNRPDYIDRAVSEYKQAIAADPDSLFLRVELAELYSLSGHTAEGIAGSRGRAEGGSRLPRRSPSALAHLLPHARDQRKGTKASPRKTWPKPSSIWKPWCE